MAKKKIDWAAYDRSLKQRGSITFWFSDEAIRAWSPEPKGKRGGQEKFSDLAIETSLSLRLIFKQGLRQTEGLIGSIVDIMKLDIDVPDHSTLSRRGKVVNILSAAQAHCDSSESLVIIVDSTGLKIYGAGEWNENKHGLNKRREWRKLHLTINESTLEIIASSLTDNRVGDPTQRDEHVNFINSHDRSSWESKFRYYRRLLVENTVGRYKGIIGSKLGCFCTTPRKGIFQFLVANRNSPSTKAKYCRQRSAKAHN